MTSRSCSASSADLTSAAGRPSCTRSTFPLTLALGRILKQNLARIGVAVEVKGFSREGLTERLATPGEPYDIAWSPWSADYLDPYAYLNELFDGRFIPSTNSARFNSPRYNLRLRRAARLPGPARYRAYGKLDAELARVAAPMAAIWYANDGTFVSKRVGWVVIRPGFGLDPYCRLPEAVEARAYPRKEVPRGEWVHPSSEDGRHGHPDGLAERTGRPSLKTDECSLRRGTEACFRRWGLLVAAAPAGARATGLRLPAAASAAVAVPAPCESEQKAGGADGQQQGDLRQALSHAQYYARPPPGGFPQFTAATTRRNGVQAARSQNCSPHVGHGGSVCVTTAPWPHAAQLNSPLPEAPAGQSST